MRRRYRLLVIVVFTLAIAAAAAYWHSSRSQEPRGKDVVATIDGEPVTYDEFQFMLAKNKTKTAGYFESKYGAKPGKAFWTTSYGGETPLEKLKRDTLADAVRVKIPQQLAKKRGIVDDVSYAAVLRQLNAENGRRAKAENEGEAVFGPLSLDRAEFYDAFNSNLLDQLKQAMDKEANVSEAEIKRAYDAGKEKRFKLQDAVTIVKLTLDGEDAKNKLNEIAAEINKGAAWADAIAPYAERIRTEKQVLGPASAHSDAIAYPELYPKLLALRPGEATDAFQENRVYRIALCTDRTGGGYRPYEEVKEGIRSDLVAQAVDKKLQSLIDGAAVVIRHDVYDRIAPNGAAF